VAFAPDVRLDAPGMLYPRRSPAQCMKIDWTNPLTKGLKFYGLARTGVFIEELVQGYTIDISTSTHIVSRGKGGICLRNTGTTGTSGAIKPIETLNGITLLVSYTLSTTVTSSPQVLFELQGNEGSFDEFASIFHDYDSIVPAMQYKTETQGTYSNFIYNDHSLVLGETASLILTTSLDLFITGYANGRGLYNNTENNLVLEDMQFETLTLSGYYYNPNGYSLADIYAIAAFDGDMNKEQMKALSIDPYAFLIPNRG